MKLLFKYNFFKEIQASFELITHYNDYKNLRSVLWPTPRNILGFAFSSSNAILHTQKLWCESKSEVEKVFKELKLKDPGRVDCFLHGISCEGWFDTDENSISVRYVENGGDRELLSTIIHELLHLATFKDSMNYDEREDVVDKYLCRPEFQNILSKKIH